MNDTYYYYVQKQKNITKKNQSAFTLAETLLSIGIVGIISMLLIPGVIEGYKEKATIAALKKSYALTTAAFNTAVAENGSPDNWELGPQGDEEGLGNLNRILSESLNVIKNCGTGSGCFPESKYRGLDGTQNPIILDQDTSYTKMQLADGTSLALKSWDENCNIIWGDTNKLSNVCGIIGIDINGVKEPNTYGEDYFGFVITKYGVLPMGSAPQYSYNFNQYCNKDKGDMNTPANGLSCTAWVLYNENLDYKEKNTLSWSGEGEVIVNGNNGNNNTNGNNNNGQTDNNCGNNNTNGNENPVGSNYNNHSNNGNNLSNGNTNGNNTSNGNNNKTLDL